MSSWTDSEPPNSEITSLHFYVSADVIVVLFFLLNTRDVFHKILFDFSGPGAVRQQPAWG